MIIKKAFKIRLYPTKTQETMFRQHAGNTRFLWNYFLNQNNEQYKKDKNFKFGKYELSNQLPKLKKQKEYEFLDISYCSSLQQVSHHFEKAMKDFLNHKKGYPKFKKKSNNKDSFKIPTRYKIYKNHVYIPKIGKVKWIKKINIQGKVKHLTISQDIDHWYCSVNVEINQKDIEQKVDKIVGVDVGIKTYATLSDNNKVENPRIIRKYERKLKREQKKLSKKKKDSKNRAKQRDKLAKIHRKIRFIRKDFLHKTTHRMITKYDVIILETLNIAGMVKNHKLAKAVSDCSWFEFKRQLKYKACWYGKTVLEIDRFEPTSKKCCRCGHIKKDLKLSDRVYHCYNCGLILDRDWNASINIENLGRKLLKEDSVSRLLSGRQDASATSVSGKPVEIRNLSMKQEQNKVSKNFDPKSSRENLGNAVTVSNS